MAEQHALITGPISGTVDTRNKSIPRDSVDVTPDVLYFDDVTHAQDVAAAIEELHYANGTHPLQVAASDASTEGAV